MLALGIKKWKNEESKGGELRCRTLLSSGNENKTEIIWRNELQDTHELDLQCKRQNFVELLSQVEQK